MPEYPARPKFFANKVIRLLGKTCAANDIGLAAVWLVTQIVMTEDASGYRRAVTFYDGQLMPIVGVNSQKTLALARVKAVEAGWLAYEAGFKGKAGQYFVTIPQAALDLDDAPMDEGEEECAADSRRLPRKIYVESGDEPTGQRGTNLQGKGQTILPIPVPIPRDITQGERETFLTGRSEAFNRFMAVYPRPKAPEAAWQVWQAKVYQLAMSLNRPDAEIEEMLIARPHSTATARQDCHHPAATTFGQTPIGGYWITSSRKHWKSGRNRTGSSPKQRAAPRRRKTCRQ